MAENGGRVACYTSKFLGAAAGGAAGVWFGGKHPRLLTASAGAVVGMFTVVAIDALINPGPSVLAQGETGGVWEAYTFFADDGRMFHTRNVGVKGKVRALLRNQQIVAVDAEGKYDGAPQRVYPGPQPGIAVLSREVAPAR